MVLKSRQYRSPEDFKSDFLGTLTPGIIPRNGFIKWDLIEKKIEHLSPLLDFFENLNGKKDPVRELADSLLSCDKPFTYIKCAFELLGHTDTQIVTNIDDLDMETISGEIDAHKENAAIGVSKLLFDLGLA